MTMCTGRRSLGSGARGARCASLSLLLMGLGGVAAPACGSSSNAGNSLALLQACTLNSDCASGLTCALGKCRAQCVTSADCAGGTCVSSGTQAVCRSAAEESKSCRAQSDCPSPLACASDYRCRNLCLDDTECNVLGIKGRVCASDATGVHYCADAAQADGGTLIAIPPSDAPQTAVVAPVLVGPRCSAQSTTSASGCGSGACVLGFCRQPCSNDLDCGSGGICLSSGGVAGCRLASEAVCSVAVACTAGLVCAGDGTCRNACSAAQPCPGAWQTCSDGVCVLRHGDAGSGFPPDDKGAADAGTGTLPGVDGGAGGSSNSTPDSAASGGAGGASGGAGGASGGAGGASGVALDASADVATAASGGASGSGGTADAGSSNGVETIAHIQGVTGILSISVEESMIYATVRPTAGGASNYGLIQVSADGGPVTTVVMGVPSANLVKQGTNFYYWSSSSGGTISSVPLAGGATSIVASNLSNANGTFAADANYLYLFFSSCTSTALDGGSCVSGIETVPIGGGPVTPLGSLSQAVPSDSPSNYLSASYPVLGGGNVCWLESFRTHPAVGSSLTTPSIRCVPIGGGDIRTLASWDPMPETSSADGGAPSTLVTDGVNLYWLVYTPYYDGGIYSGGSPPTDGVTTLYAVPMSGGEVATLASVPHEKPSNFLATDGHNVYWYDSASRAIMSVLVGGGQASTFVDGLGNNPDSWPASLAVDTRSVYWASGTSGYVFKKAKP